ncbi:MAG TPA: hypothetical protein VJN96_03395 [Vicinamibacterales bacterium]|nr:hypothetical protein [Vicinamibacterales bacterium]
MRPASDARTRPIDASRQAEDILGQFYCAFAQGAGAMRIRRGAIRALRGRYFGPIQTLGAQWEEIAPSVLPLLAQVGRLAALLATQTGRTAISAADFMRARRIVEASAHNSSQLLICGPVCPPIAGEEGIVPGSSADIDEPCEPIQSWREPNTSETGPPQSH